jgi:hypothetical protein
MANAISITTPDGTYPAPIDMPPRYAKMSKRMAATPCIALDGKTTGKLAMRIGTINGTTIHTPFIFTNSPDR